MDLHRISFLPWDRIHLLRYVSKKKKRVAYFFLTNTSKIRSGFNFLAPFYDLFSGLVFGRSLVRSQTHFLPELKKVSSVLIVGGGTGKLLIACLENKNGNEYTYVDISDKMIAKTKSRLRKYIQNHSLNEKIEFINASYAEIPSTKKFDLIITPYVLDCFSEDELSKAIPMLDQRLLPNGNWLFIDFNIPPKGFMRRSSQFMVSTLYFFFHIICGLGIKRLPNFQSHFERLNFKIEKEKYFLKGMLSVKVYSRT